MKAIGGYFELELRKAPLYYPDGIYLNSCRNCIRYLIRALGIKVIHVPYYTCDVVFSTIKQEGCNIKKYHLDEKMMPVQSFGHNDFIIYNNYFGVLGKNVQELAKLYPNLIVDNAQAFYSTPACRAIIYSPRKFFGVPDGGILRGKDLPGLNLEESHSFKMCAHLLKRIDLGAQTAYNEFVANDRAIASYPLRIMSPLTVALMNNIDYDAIKIKRLQNYKTLKNQLSTLFPISIANDDVPMIYPYFVKYGSEVRKRLIANQIFCATYWPNILSDTHSSLYEKELAQDLIALPIDQRYGDEDMNSIFKQVKIHTHYDI